MRFVNRTRFKAYCTAIGATVQPGRSTSDRDIISGFIESLRHDSKGFGLLLSDKDIDCIQWLLDSDESARGALSIPPPKPCDHAARVSAELKAVRAVRQKIASDRIDERLAREARIQSESNYLDDKGRPVNDKMTASAATIGVEPELHPEMTTDVKSVLANNLAMMDKFKKAPNTTVAGETKVSTDPRYYQNLRRTTPPGMPDVPGAAETARAAAEANRPMRGQPLP